MPEKPQGRLSQPQVPAAQPPEAHLQVSSGLPPSRTQFLEPEQKVRARAGMCDMSKVTWPVPDTAKT